MRCDIKDLIGENCITLDNGQRVYDQIHPELVAGRSVEVDFTGVSVFASPFFNAAFGRFSSMMMHSEFLTRAAVLWVFSGVQAQSYSPVMK